MLEVFGPSELYLPFAQNSANTIKILLSLFINKNVLCKKSAYTKRELIYRKHLSEKIISVYTFILLHLIIKNRFACTAFFPYFIKDYVNSNLLQSNYFMFQLHAIMFKQTNYKILHLTSVELSCLR